MTKLLQWLLGASLLGAIWAVVAFDPLELSLPRTYREVAWPMPLYLLVSFGCYSLATVGYRVATFNDCDEAARELQEQIKEAKEDLRRKGLKMILLIVSRCPYAKYIRSLQHFADILVIVIERSHMKTWTAHRRISWMQFSLSQL
uniref:Dolichol-phosphate mannosyltransferase subunit 3 n=2 Tax=Fundulus heteroclitus TaxID=8078 RepID=A0A3Q2PEC3_FUNHE